MCHAAALKMKATDARARSGLARYYKYRGYAQLWEATRKVEDESPEAQTQRERRLRRAGMEDFSKGLGFAGGGPEFTVIRKQLQRYVDQLLVDGRTNLDGLQFEVARTQGDAPQEVEPPCGFKLLGNSMSFCVLEPIIVALLQSIFPDSTLTSPWQTGQAQH